MRYLHACLHVLLCTAYGVAGFMIFENFGLWAMALYFAVLWLILRTINRALDWFQLRFRWPDQ